MLRRTMRLSHLMILVLMIVVPAKADSIPVANHSFEIPEVNPLVNPYGAIPLTALWTELDIDQASQSTGVFRNTPADSNDHIINADGSQLAFLGSYQGNSISQFLASKYKVGKSYQLTVSVCLSDSAPPVGQNPLTLAFLYWGVFEPITIATVQIPSTGLTSTFLEDFTLSIPPIEAEDPWINNNIGISIAASGNEGGFWDLDNIRIMEYPRTPNFTDDAVVNLADFAKMAADWQLCNDPLTDVTGDGCANEQDLLILMEYWLSDI